MTRSNMCFLAHELKRLFSCAVLALGSREQARSCLQVVFQHAVARRQEPALRRLLRETRIAAVRQIAAEADRHTPIAIMGQLPQSSATVACACLALQPRERVLFLARECLEMPCEEIADALDINIEQQTLGIASTYGRLASMIRI